MIINCFLFIPSTWHYLYVILIYKAFERFFNNVVSNAT